MAEKDRDFKGVWIPKEIWLSQELGPMEKLIFAEIHALDNEFGCKAKNAHFMDFFGLSERQVREYIKRLKDKELISVEVNKANNSRVIRVLGKYARVSAGQIEEVGFLKAELAEKWRRLG